MADLLDRNPPRPAPSKGCGYEARVPFDHGERHFKPGDPYPYAELGKHELEAYNMWRAGMLAVAAPRPDAAPPSAPTAPVAAPAKHSDRRPRR